MYRLHTYFIIFPGRVAPNEVQVPWIPSTTSPSWKVEDVICEHPKMPTLSKGGWWFVGTPMGRNPQKMHVCKIGSHRSLRSQVILSGMAQNLTPSMFLLQAGAPKRFKLVDKPLNKSYIYHNGNSYPSCKAPGAIVWLTNFGPLANKKSTAKQRSQVVRRSVLTSIPTWSKTLWSRCWWSA